MDELELLRNEINRIDEVLIDFFKKRMDIIDRVAEYKIKNSMDVLDKLREEEVINRHLRDIDSKDLKIRVKEFLESIMCISRNAQIDKIKELTIKHNYLK